MDNFERFEDGKTPLDAKHLNYVLELARKGGTVIRQGALPAKDSNTTAVNRITFGFTPDRTLHIWTE